MYCRGIECALSLLRWLSGLWRESSVSSKALDGRFAGTGSLGLTCPAIVEQNTLSMGQG